MIAASLSLPSLMSVAARASSDWQVTVGLLRCKVTVGLVWRLNSYELLVSHIGNFYSCILSATAETILNHL